MALFLLNIPSWAQDQAKEIPAEAPSLRKGLGLSVAHLLDPIQPGVYVSFLHQTRDLVFMRYQLGYLLFLNYADQDGMQDLHGVRVRVNRRKYQTAPSGRGHTSYWEAGVDYRYLDATIAGDFSRENSAFNQRIDYQMWQHSVSFNFLAGPSVALSDRLRIDIGVGAGLRLNYRQFSSVPPDTFFRTNGNLWLWNYGSREGFHATLSTPIIIDLCYYW